MEKITFSQRIAATKEKVWSVLWDDATYRKWTSVFSESSHAETDWKEGSKVLFIDDERNGMVSIIETLRPNSMSFRHIGELKNGIEDTESESVKVWAGSHENYNLHDVEGKTVLTVEMDISNDIKEYFLKTFPKALELVKLLAEE